MLQRNNITLIILLTDVKYIEYTYFRKPFLCFIRLLLSISIRPSRYSFTLKLTTKRTLKNRPFEITCVVHCTVHLIRKVNLCIRGKSHILKAKEKLPEILLFNKTYYIFLLHL